MVDFLHLGWPNTAAVLVLALVPFASLGLPSASADRVNRMTVAAEMWVGDAQCHALGETEAPPALTAPRLT
jgi:hypothetical protein